MWLINRIAEKKINEAIRNGELHGLPGEGKPLELDDDSLVPEELRVAYRILKNAGFLPSELNIRRQIATVDQLLSQAVSETEKASLNKRMHYLMLQLNQSRSFSSALLEDYYVQKLYSK